MLENVTVIIPAHNRPERLQRLLDYYSGTDIRILIPDSSDTRFSGKLDSPNITYVHRPKEHMLVKVREVLPLISTDYVLYCADDDFAVPAGIAKMVQFLEQNKDYSIAQGHYLTFTPEQNGKVTFYPRYIRNFLNKISDDNAKARLAHEKGMYASMLYGVTRTEVFRTIYSYCFNEQGNLRYKNLFLAEEFFNHAVLIQGKYATLPYFFSARERIKGSATETTTPLSVIKNSPAYKDEYGGFITALALMLADKEGIELKDAEDYMRYISACPMDSQSVIFKRKVNSFISKHRLLHWASQLSEWRYHQKGLKAVKGMASYPCTFTTSDTEAILRAING